VTNEVLLKLLARLPKSTYIGYTATPYANICVTTGDEDIYPDHFIHLLDAPSAYHGYAKFFDIDEEWSDDGADTASTTVNWESVNIRSQEDYSALREFDSVGENAFVAGAIDSWVLAGALKLWKMASDPSYAGRFQEHTFLYHDSHLKDDHEAVCAELLVEWKRLGFEKGLQNLSAETLQRLEWSYQDFVTTSEGLADLSTFWPLPDFESLKPHIHESVKAANSEIRVVIGDDESDYWDTDNPVFVLNADKVRSLDWKQPQNELLQPSGDGEVESQPIANRTGFRVCKIIVGGNMLSRGYTVEGLTTVVFGRASQQVDTLLQMGRWFGYRDSYRELMRIVFEPRAKKNQIAASELLVRFRVFGAVDRDVREMLLSEQDTWGLGKEAQAPAISRVVTRLIEDPEVGDWFRPRLTAKNNGFVQIPKSRVARPRYRFGAMDTENVASNWRESSEFLGGIDLEESVSVTPRPESPKGQQSVFWLAGKVEPEAILDYLCRLRYGKSHDQYDGINDLRSAIELEATISSAVLVRTLERKTPQRRSVAVGRNSLNAVVSTTSFGVEEPLVFVGGGPIDRSIEGALGVGNLIRDLDELHKMAPFVTEKSRDNAVILVLNLMADEKESEGGSPSLAVFPYLYLGAGLVEKVTHRLAPVNLPPYSRDAKGREMAGFVQVVE
jgi:hypothetical protein